ncbi:MAG: sulfatase [Verrucomicrobiota bacterium]
MNKRYLKFKIRTAVLFLLPWVTQSNGLLAASPSKPNVVVFLVDDFSAGALSAFGSDLHETPNIDRLASSGAVFSQGYAACTVCSPSRAALLTGKAPGRTNLTDWIPGHIERYKGTKLLIPKWTMHMEHSEVTLAEALKEQGYVTAFFGKWHLMPFESDVRRIAPENLEVFEQHYPEDHGFDINIGGREWGQPKGKGKYFHPFDMPNVESKPGDFLTDRLTDYAVEFIESHQEEPFLLYFSYYTVHGPFMGKPELVEKYQAKLSTGEFHQRDAVYAAMVESLDDSVGRVIAKLEELGISDNTLIIFTGDNGSAKPIYAQAAGLKNFKASAYEGGVREPFFISGLGIPAGTQINTPVISMDFYPTILDLIGAPQKPQQHLDGTSLKTLLYGKGDIAERSLFWHYPHYHRTTPYSAIIKGDMKLIEFMENGKLELYNLKDDLREQRNLASVMPEKTAQMLAELNTWREDVDAQMMEINPNHKKTH